MDTIPTSAGRKTTSAWPHGQASSYCGFVKTPPSILAIELLASAHAIDAMRPSKSTAALEHLHNLIRQHAPLDRKDHRLDRQIAALTKLIQTGKIAEFLHA